MHPPCSWNIFLLRASPQDLGIRLDSHPVLASKTRHTSEWAKMITWLTNAILVQVDLWSGMEWTLTLQAVPLLQLFEVAVQHEVDLSFSVWSKVLLPNQLHNNRRQNVEERPVYVGYVGRCFHQGCLWPVLERENRSLSNCLWFHLAIYWLTSNHQHYDTHLGKIILQIASRRVLPIPIEKMMPCLSLNKLKLLMKHPLSTWTMGTQDRPLSNHSIDYEQRTFKNNYIKCEKSWMLINVISCVKGLWLLLGFLTNSHHHHNWQKSWLL